MQNRKTIARIALLTCAIGAGIVVACGPDFPAQLLDDRAGTLRSTPANSFSYEASRLVVPAEALRAQELRTLPGGNDRQDAIPEDFDPALSPAQRATVRAMRQLPDGDQAYAAGATLPEAVRLYTAAAVDILAAANDETDVAVSRARARLQAVLALPGNEGAARSVWAAYMLAELENGASAAMPVDATPPGPASAASAASAAYAASAASAAYARVRQLARDGAPDPWGLAIASFGQEARGLLRGSQGGCTYEDFQSATSCADAIPATALKHAIQLYAEQAARGSSSGQASLRLIASWALNAPARAVRLIDDPVSQRLLVAYALARVGDIVDGNPDSAYDIFATYEVNGQRGYADAAALAGRGNVTPNPALQVLATALAKQDVSRIQNADRVAALAYRVGRYDLAQPLAERLDTPLAWWIRAKLAIRRGDMAAAAQAYARAASSFPNADEHSIDAPGIARLTAERGVLALSRGQYVEALDLLLHANDPSAADLPEGGWLQSPYWNDAAYVAERVLTVDELKHYVDQHVPASAMPATPPGFLQFDYQRFYEWAVKHPIPDGDRLRLLLARRLMREGRMDQALAYFPSDADARFADLTDDAAGVWRVRPSSRHQKVEEYIAALHKAGNAWGRTARAEAWFTAARLARRNGLEIMGYEQDPDFAVYDGNYTYGAGRSPEPWRQSAGADASQTPDTPAQRADAALPGPLVTPEERQRFAASEARPYARFHYRQIAADHALQAAGQLPNRSQAFAAVLCQGARYIIDDSPDRASAIYLRYVNQGAQVPFSGTFGRECAEPDFRGAAWFHYTQAWKAWERLRRDHAGLLLAVGLLVIVAGGGCVFAWRMPKRTPKRTAKPTHEKTQA